MRVHWNYLLQTGIGTYIEGIYNIFIYNYFLSYQKRFLYKTGIFDM